MPKSFFSYVWRFNALAIAAVSALAFFIGCYAAFQIAREVFYRPYQAANIARVEPAATGAEPSAPQVRTDVTLTDFYPIRGAGTLWATLEAKQSYAYEYSSKVASSTRNVVFYDVANGVSRKLLADERALIVDRREIRADEANEKEAPKALLFALIEKDSDNDGLLTERDGVTIAMTRANGDGLKRIDHKIAHLRGITLHGAANEVVVMAETAGDLKALHIDLGSFETKRVAEVAR